MTLRFVCALAIAFLACALPAQDQSNTPQTSDPFTKFDADLAQYRLAKCDDKLKLYDAWYAKAKNEYGDLQKENEDLRVELALNDKAHTLLGFWIVGIVGGVSIGVLILIAKWVRRMTPLSTARKQLIALVLGAIWISGAGFVAVNDSQLSRHPVNMAFTVAVYSLPAVLFAGIAFWWFGKAKQAA